jgi:hypothetical protein
MDRKSREGAGEAAPLPRGHGLKQIHRGREFRRSPRNAQDIDTAIITADFSGVPPGSCHGCRRPFAHNEAPIWGGWTADGFARLGNCCSASLEIVALREVRWPQ